MEQNAGDNAVQLLHDSAVFGGDSCGTARMAGEEISHPTTKVTSGSRAKSLTHRGSDTLTLQDGFASPGTWS